MTNLRIKGLSAHAATSLEPHIRGLFDNPNGKTMALVELEHVSRTEPGPKSDSAPLVVVRIGMLEVPSGQTQGLLMQVMRSLYLLRTARGTLDEASGEVNLASESQKIADAIGELFAVEAAAARSVLHQLLDQLEATGNLADQLKSRRRLRKLVDAGRAFLGTGNRELLSALAQETLDLPDPNVGDRVQVEVEATDTGTGPVLVGDVVPDVAPTPPAAEAPRKRAARKTAAATS